MHPEVLKAKLALHRAFQEFTKINQKAYEASTRAEKDKANEELSIALIRFNEAQHEYIETKRKYSESKKNRRS